MDQSLFRAQVFVRELWSGFTMGARQLNDGVTDGQLPEQGLRVLDTIIIKKKTDLNEK
jgi:hypothetical protein